MKEKKYGKPSDDELISSWLTDFSDAGDLPGGVPLPRFDRIWKDAFREKAVKPELIEKAMMPMKITGMFAGIISAVVLAVLFISGESVIGGVREQLGQAGESLITPLLRMFNSSIFVSIPMTLVLVSILVYLLFSIVQTVTGRVPDSI